eukprot:Filipodium_phascolosomae@DN12_c0_g1_i1.p1
MANTLAWRQRYKQFHCDCESFEGHKKVEYSFIPAKSMVHRILQAKGSYQVYVGPEAANLPACTIRKGTGFLGWWAELALIALILFFILGLLLIFMSWYYYRRKYMRCVHYVNNLHADLMDLAENSPDAAMLRERFIGLEDLYKHAGNTEAQMAARQAALEERIANLLEQVKSLKKTNVEHFTELQALQDALEMLRRKQADLKREQRARVETETIREETVIGPDGKPTVKQTTYYEEASGDEARNVIREGERERQKLLEEQRHPPTIEEEE